ncbi:PREDICTED: F-box only protein 36-like [Branchiostoma belcheri]|uniref:F-box only protein 36-like n=1 Tax=Branchiostoma belcheri TaxID=7741 RepID=A0A6P4YZK8_BRABE|nr:PREDICTED: F-box only protein 36-like [Branchiostoma belcheri]
MATSMASLVRDGVLLEMADQAPAPSKDYCQLLITTKEVIWRWWRITLRKGDERRCFPGEIRESHDDFLNDDRVQGDVRRVFGEPTLEHALGLCRGHVDFITRVPKPMLIFLVSYLELEDISQLAQTNKLFREICNSDELWEHVYERHCENVTEEMRDLAKDVGWKSMFFTNKLQLQVQLRRQRGKKDGSGDSPTPAF